MESFRLMNLNKVILLILILCSVLDINAQYCKARVQVKTDIPSAKIYIDNNLAGNGNADIKLEEGSHFIIVTEEADRWNSKSYEDTLIVTNCNDTILTYKFKSEVYLDTEPQDAYVYQ